MQKYCSATKKGCTVEFRLYALLPVHGIRNDILYYFKKKRRMRNHVIYDFTVCVLVCIYKQYVPKQF